MLVCKQISSEAGILGVFMIQLKPNTLGYVQILLSAQTLPLHHQY